ncbi:MAG: GTP 3',8-cyclase MoaA [Nitrospinota bacterium]
MKNSVDRFGRKVSYLRVSVTPRCNLRCAYCMPKDGPPLYPDKEMLTIKQITKLIGIYAPLGINKIRITGGEPLVRKGIATLIRDTKAVKGIDQVTMTTNGVLLGKMITRLTEAKLDRINISLDTLRPERMKEITGYNVFDKVMPVIKKIAVEQIWPLKVNVVAIQGINDDEILDFAKFASNLPLELRFIEMMPTAHNKLWKDKTYVKNSELEKRIRERYELVPVKQNRFSGPAVVYNIRGGKGRIGFVSPISKHFCEDCNRIRLTAEGKLLSCLFSNNEVNLLPGLKNNEKDEWFIDQLNYALKCKPMGHDLDSDSDTANIRPMISIGG